MPIVNPTSTAPAVEAPTTVRIASPMYRGVTVDSRYNPAASLLTHIEGASWTVNYYSQILDTDSQLNAQQLDLDPVFQQYRLISGMELKVTTGLTMSQAMENGTMTVTGAATVYPFIIPNVGDMFLADVGDGKEGVFQLTHAEKKTIFKETCYAIEYQMVEYSTPERLGDLKAKTIQKLFYVRDFLDHGQNPLLQEEAFHAAAQLTVRFPTYLSRWLKEHVNSEYATLTVPGQSRVIYDPFLTKAALAFFSVSDAHAIRGIRLLNVDDDPAMRAYSLWDALLLQDRSILRSGFTQAGLVSRLTFASNPMLEGVRFSGMDSLVYPSDPDATVNLPAGGVVKTMETDNLVGTPSGEVNLQDLIGNLQLDTTDLNPPAIKPVLGDAYYVLSQAFYDQATSGQSLLELCVQRYLDAKSLDGRVLNGICGTMGAWGLLERFYYTPILLVLIRAYIRGL